MTLAAEKLVLSKSPIAAKFLPAGLCRWDAMYSESDHRLRNFQSSDP
jgi:hypothetical protein